MFSARHRGGAAHTQEGLAVVLVCERPPGGGPRMLLAGQELLEPLPVSDSQALSVPTCPRFSLKLLFQPIFSSGRNGLKELLSSLNQST